MVSVFHGRFVTEPQKAPALTRSQTVEAVTGESKRRRRAQRSGAEEEGKGKGGEDARAEREE